MEDKIVIGVACDGTVRVLSAITTSTVLEATKVHNCTPLAAAALGRMITAGSLMGAMLKSDDEVITLKIDGGGIAKGVVVTAYGDASVKGYIGNPCIELPSNGLGKHDVGKAIGKEGDLVVIKDIGLKEPYVGHVPISSGEIGDDISYYFTASEQIPTAVGLGVLTEKESMIKAAGGFIIQMMPGSDELAADLITYRLQEIESITGLIEKNMDAEDILKYIFEGMDLKILGEKHPKFSCDCSRERIERVLISIGKEELQSIYDENKTEEIVCHFCNKKYEFTHEDLKKLIDML